MKKVFCTMLSVLLGAALWTGVLPGAAPAATTIEREFRYGPSRFGLTLNADGTTQVQMSGSTRDYAPGRPDLPLMGERVLLPPGQRLAAVEVIELETASLAHGVRLPSTELMRPGVDSVERTAPDPAYFGRADFVPERLVQAGVQGFERGRGVAYVVVAPVRWNPATGELERIARVRVRLVLESTAERPLERERVVPEWEDGGLGAAAPERARPSRPPWPGARAGGALQGHAAALGAGQPGRLRDRHERCDGPGLPAARGLEDAERGAGRGAHDLVHQAAVPVRRRRRRARASLHPGRLLALGHEVGPAGGRHRRDPHAARLHHLLRRRAHRHGPVLLVPGRQLERRRGQPLWRGRRRLPPTPGDSADLLPEVYVGRAPASTLAEAQLFVDKTLQYEKQPVADYMNNLLFFAEVLFPQPW